MPAPAMDAVFNLRDLGGRPGAGGRLVATGRLFRSASLEEMTPEDCERLAGLRVTTIIDLRTRWERERQPYRAGFARVVPAPLADEGMVAEVTRRFTAGTLTSEELEDWWTLIGIYEAPDRHAGAIRTAFEAILEAPPEEAVLFHCRGGKDRTGVLAALVLTALGVSRAGVLDDFLAGGDAPYHGSTAEAARMAGVVERMGLSAAARRALIGVEPAWMDRLLDGIAARHGSVDRYLAGPVGLGEGGLKRLRAAYLR